MTQNLVRGIFLTALLFTARADWPMLRGSAAHTGYVEAELPRSFRLEWAVEFQGERIGSAVEPIVANGTLFIGTQSGTLHALDPADGTERWSVPVRGAILQSPAAHRNRVFVASVSGHIHALDATSGAPAWRHAGPFGGYSAAPILADETLIIGSRSGEFLCLDVKDGAVRWRKELRVPIRQTAAAAVDSTRVYVTTEDLRLRAFDLASGKELWTSEPMWGQTARDYYPIVLEHSGRRFVIVRTNPLLTMSHRIGRDRTMLARNAGFDDSAWQKVDAWIKSDAARGTPDLWSRESHAISTYLTENPDAQTMYIFDATTGQPANVPPVLWIAGCQSVGAQPAQTRAGTLLTFFRSAYGNWNHGVAPLVALGLLDVRSNSIAPLFHQQGRQPAWNCFWGTADESQNFVVAGNTALSVHQGTLSGFDLTRNELFAIHGERDTYGGFRSPSWARNEWHGPGRGGVAVDGQRLYWQTGSRILCLAPGAKNKTAQITTIAPARPTASIAPGAPAAPGASTAPPQTPIPLARVPDDTELRASLARAVEEWLSDRWAPLFVDPGLSGREFFFTHSGHAFETAAAAYRHLPEHLQQRLRQRLRHELNTHPPFLASGAYPLNEGRAREWFQVPPAYRARIGNTSDPHPFAHLWQLWAWTRTADEHDATFAHWPAILESYRAFQKRNWKLDPAKGDLHANSYIASLRAFAEMALRRDEPALAEEARTAAGTSTKALLDWWQRAAEAGTLGSFQGSGELDPFINRGDAISFKVTPHKHKIALFHDLSPELFATIQQAPRDPLGNVWTLFSQLYKTWPLQGEERQVHFGENFVDPPDLAFGAFKILVWSGKATRAQKFQALDLPSCRADLHYIQKLALALQD